MFPPKMQYESNNSNKILNNKYMNVCECGTACALVRTYACNCISMGVDMRITAYLHADKCEYVNACEHAYASVYLCMRACA